MNANEMTSKIQAMIQQLNPRSPTASVGAPAALALPALLAASGAGCLGAAALLGPAALNLVPAFCSAGVAGTLGAMAGLKIGGAGLAVCGAALSVPATAIAAVLGLGSAVVSGSGVWLWQFFHPAGASIWIIGLKTLGAGLVVAGLVAGSYVLWQRLA